MSVSKLISPRITSQRIVLAIVSFAWVHAALSQTHPPDSESAKNLKRVIEELQEAAKLNDSERFRLTAEPLFFAGHEVWFKEVFGERFGTHASGTYATRTTEFVNSLRAAFEKLDADGLTKPQVQELDEPCAPLVLTVEYPVLFARKKKTPLYSVRFEKDRKYTTLGFFAYHNGGFRYVGHVDLGPVFRGPIKVGGNIQARKLVHKVRPQYPWRARRLRIQGTVRLQAIVGIDGAVQDLQLVSGQCYLAEAAIEAVRRWRYQPTSINGVPLEVSTTIDVIFTLSN
ncbi:MAG: energy transducer TonB [Candidatus Acidiferrales bacterium]